MHSSKHHHTQIDKFHHIARLGVYAILILLVVAMTVSLNSPETSVGNGRVRADVNECNFATKEICERKPHDLNCVWLDSFDCDNRKGVTNQSPNICYSREYDFKIPVRAWCAVNDTPHAVNPPPATSTISCGDMSSLYDNNGSVIVDVNLLNGHLLNKTEVDMNMYSSPPGSAPLTRLMAPRTNGKGNFQFKLNMSETRKMLKNKNISPDKFQVNAQVALVPDRSTKPNISEDLAYGTSPMCHMTVDISCLSHPDACPPDAGALTPSPTYGVLPTRIPDGRNPTQTPTPTLIANQPIIRPGSGTISARPEFVNRLRIDVPFDFTQLQAVKNSRPIESKVYFQFNNRIKRIVGCEYNDASPSGGLKVLQGSTKFQDEDVITCSYQNSTKTRILLQYYIDISKTTNKDIIHNIDGLFVQPWEIGFWYAYDKLYKWIPSEEILNNNSWSIETDANANRVYVFAPNALKIVP